MRTRLLVVITLGTLAGLASYGQENDPPSRAARLSFLRGTVSFQPGEVEDWIPATLNRPLTTGDRLWTENGARAEMHTGSSAFRLSGHTNFAFLNLDDHTAQVQISLGSLNVRLRKLADDETVEIDTPQVAFSLLRPGEYRIDVNEQGDTTIVTVRGGEGEATAGGDVFAIHPREQVRIVNGATDAARPTYDRRPMPPGDPFDNWCQDRDRREDMSQSAKYVSREMPGYSDLDGAGVWREDPSYGAIWMPSRVAVGWAPYHDGHWAWIEPWGWTWVDDAPWGYAPFHYGRWMFVGGSWGWIPGPIAVHPVYAPAMVAWVGGARFGAALSIGGGGGVGVAVGWFPLGFGEVWVPSYHASGPAAYFNRVNVSNTVVNNVTVTNVYNNTIVNKTVVNNTTYVNQHVSGAVTAVPQSAMVSGRPVAQAAVRVPPNAVASAQVQQTSMVAPERAAVLGGRTAGSVAPPAAASNRPMVARATPPPPSVPFAQQRTALQANPGQPVTSTAMTQMQRTAPAPASQSLIRSAGVPAPSRPQGSISAVTPGTTPRSRE